MVFSVMFSQFRSQLPLSDTPSPPPLGQPQWFLPLEPPRLLGAASFRTAPSTPAKEGTQPPASAMLSRSRCLSRTVGRSLSAVSQVGWLKRISVLSLCANSKKDWTD